MRFLVKPCHIGKIFSICVWQCDKCGSNCLIDW